ncbi:MAG: acyl-CoA dehydrogenase [Bacteroidia bacterium]|nr:acyl-CoA dehydrogenase [Bacteroidia bacterium]
MPRYINIDHVKFILHEVLNVKQLCAFERYMDYDAESFNMLLSSAKDYSDKHLFPLFRELDQQAAHYKDGEIIVHPLIGKFMKDAGSIGFIGTSFDYDHGGMQLPVVMANALAHIYETAHNHVTGYTGLTGGSAHLIINFGNQELIDQYVPKMMAGEWAGTMCLTEPQAGSSLSDITTSAAPTEDGYYKIKGQKIFISGGDHTYCENFVHLVLARIEGAPAGTKGISLFVVPKKRIDSDNNLASNDVITAGDFQKMGQKGYCTTHLVFGENDDCRGWLVGEAHKGLRYMFQMMNGARIDVGLSAASVATAAYYASLEYAQERPQGRRILAGGQKDLSAEQTLIINHPDVRRMLMLQKAISEASVSLLLEVSFYDDMYRNGPEDKREDYNLLIELLTPVAKTYPAEMGITSVSNGIQVLGGYGYCNDYLLEQYFRDIRIMALYEGTTGIQSLDLLGRKVPMQNGKALKLLVGEIMKTCEKAEKHDELKNYSSMMVKAIGDMQETTMHLMKFAMEGQNERFISDATVYMEMAGTVIIGWQWLKMAGVAAEMLESKNGKAGDTFYKSKIHTMKFFFKYEMPKVKACKETILSSDNLTIMEEYPEMEF